MGGLVHTANEAACAYLIFNLLLLCTKLGEGVDNDTENDVQQNNNHDNKEREVERHAEAVLHVKLPVAVAIEFW